MARTSNQDNRKAFRESEFPTSPKPRDYPRHALRTTRIQKYSDWKLLFSGENDLGLGFCGYLSFENRGDCVTLPRLEFG
jgi:hypothetical protein